MRRFLLLLTILLATIFFSSPAMAQIDYSEAFVGGTGYSPGDPQYDNWISYRSSLSAGNYSSITVSGTNNPGGISCAIPATATSIVNALNTGTASTFTCSGQTWRTGSCGTGIELTIGAGTICQCNNNAFTIRPTLGAGNTNWGGAGGGSTCGAPSQTLTVSVEEDSTPPTINVIAPLTHSNNSYTAEFEFSKSVSGFDISDIAVVNGAASGFVTLSASSYTAIITPTGNLDVTVSVAAGAAQDSNGGLLSNSDSTLTIFIPSPTGGGALDVYSEDFVGGAGYGPGDSQYDNWLAFRAGLTADIYNTVTVSGTNNLGGISCTNPATTTLIANALNSGSSSTFTCDGQTWKTGTCGTGIELTIGAGAICQCSPNAFTLRPTLQAGNANWGGAGGGATCNASSQNLTVEFDTDTEPPLVSITDIPTTTDGSTPFTLTYTFSEVVSGLTLSEIQDGLTNATASNLIETVPGLRFTVTITPDSLADVIIGLDADVVQDASGNGNDAPIDETVPFASSAELTAEKTITVFDPLGEGLYALPGNDVIYTITITNVGDGPTDDDSIILIDALPTEVIFFNGDADGPGPETDPVIFTEIVAPTGLDPFDYAADVKFSDAGTKPADMSECGYDPISPLDTVITYICLNPKGAMQGGDPNPQFSMSFRARIQ